MVLDPAKLVRAIGRVLLLGLPDLAPQTLRDRCGDSTAHALRHPPAEGVSGAIAAEVRPVHDVHAGNKEDLVAQPARGERQVKVLEPHR